MNVIVREEGRIVIRPAGKITAATVPALEEDIRQALDPQPLELIIDCLEVQDIDSIGVGLLVATHNSLSQKGGKLIVVNTDQEIYDLFRIMRLTDHFQVTVKA